MDINNVDEMTDGYSSRPELLSRAFRKFECARLRIEQSRHVEQRRGVMSSCCWEFIVIVTVDMINE